MSIQLSGIRGVVFDLDDTLYPERAYALSGFRAVGAWLQGRIACPADPAARMIELFEAGVRGRIFNQILTEWNHPEPIQPVVDEMVRVYREHVPAIELAPDARAVLDAWHGRFRLGLISDGPEVMQRRKVAALGLERWLDPIVLTDAFGRAYWKPHPRAFETVQTAWGFAGRECVYIADNPSKDFVAPRALGWRTVQMCRQEGEYGQVATAAAGEPDCLVQALTEIELTH